MWFIVLKNDFCSYIIIDNEIMNIWSFEELFFYDVIIYILGIIKHWNYLSYLAIRIEKFIVKVYIYDILYIQSDLLLLLLTNKNFEQVMNIDNINERINYNIERDIRD